MLLSLSPVSLQFFASSKTVQSATCCTRSRVIKPFHENAPHLEELIPPKRSVSYRLILTPGCSISWVWRLFANQLYAEGIIVSYCHSRFVCGIESSLHDFFSCLCIFIFSILFSLERAIAYCLLITSFVARSLSWILSDDQLSCKISAFFCAMKCSIVQSGTNCLCTCWGLDVRAYSWVEESLTSSTD